jgi:hypothetical protein
MLTIRLRMPGSLVVLTLVSMLAVAGCVEDPARTEGAPPPAKASGSAPEATSTAKDGAKKPKAEESKAEEPEGPLAAYLGSAALSFGTGGPRVGRVEWSDEARASGRKIEDLTVACMREQGFEYRPYLYEDALGSKFDQAYDLPPGEFAAQYGYGITTIDFEASQQRKDPNTPILAGLSAGAKKAYHKALSGPAWAVGGGVVEVPMEGSTPDEDPGCRAKALKAESPQNYTNRFSSLIKDMSALFRRVDTDPRVTAAARRWSDCLADGGRTGLVKPADASAAVSDRLDRLRGAGTTTPTKVDPAKLAELRRFEIDTAKLDLRCRNAGYDEVYRAAQTRLETEFVQQHKAALDAYKDYRANEKGGR